MNAIELVSQRDPGSGGEGGRSNKVNQLMQHMQGIFFGSRRDCTLPVGLDVVRPTKELDLPGAGRQSLYHAVDLVGFVAGGADLQDKAVQT